MSFNFVLKPAYAQVRPGEIATERWLLGRFGEERKELKDPAVFNSVKLCFDTIEWNNKADCDPEILFRYSVPVID